MIRGFPETDAVFCDCWLGPTEGLSQLRFSIFKEALMTQQRQSLFDLTGKVAVILGGTSGIGLAITEALYSAGATVVPSSRREAAVRSAVERFCQPGVKGLVCPADVD